MEKAYIKYKILQLNTICPYKCSITCKDCNICIHMYSCSCPDAVIRATICKHIHLVVQSLNNNTTQTQSASCSSNDRIQDQHLLQRLKQCGTGSVSKCRDEVQKSLMIISGYIPHVTDKDTLHQVQSYLTSAINIIKANQSSSVATLPAVKHQPPNKKITPQKAFFSTKRKRKSGNIRMARPTLLEKKNICTALLNNSTDEERQPMTQTIYCK